MRWRWRRTAALLLFPVAGALACHEERTSTTLRTIQLAPASLDFGAVYPGAEASLTFELRNPGRNEQSIRLEPPPPPFFLVSPPSRAVTGTTLVTVVFAPGNAGPAAGVLVVHDEAGGRQALELSGTGKPIPPCPVPVTCSEELFDLQLGRCVRRTLEDGTACDPHDACVRDATCQQGVCRGTTLSCDDGDACTLDVCNPLDGCHFLPAPPCPGDGRCQQGRCDSRLGCVMEQAPDGTLCELDPTCDAARICLAGACVVRDPPDGFVCRKTTPCQGEGRCQGSTCVVPAPSPLTPGWMVDAMDQGEYPPELHDFVLEPDGRITLSGWFAVPTFRANSSGRRSPPGYSRRCILWNDRVVCLDYPWRFEWPDGSLEFRQGTVAMLELDTAALLWLFDLPAARPDFVAKTERSSTLFLARVAVLASDRFAILFEGYPLGTNNSRNPATCRNYFLVLLDARGHMVSAQEVLDPFLLRCDHPHPFGFSSDAAGNLYIHFSPSLPGGAPLTPQAPGLFMSYTREGLLRWRREETWVGGEIAISGGLLYPERGDAALRGVDGSRAASIPLTGRAVASANRVVTGPQPFVPGGRLVGLDASLAQRLSAARPAGDMFLSPEIRLARWQPTGQDLPETVVLSFASLAGQRSLLAHRAGDGRRLWSCEVPGGFRGEPQLFELVSGKLGLMSGAATCGQCDPPYAHSSAAFSVLDVPTLGPVESPWLGTFAGPSHDGHEKRLVPPPGSGP